MTRGTGKTGGGGAMSVFKCRDMDMDCDFEASADSEDEFMPQIAEHADHAHDIKTISPELMDQVRQAITV